MGIGRRCVTSQHAYVKQQHNGEKWVIITKTADYPACTEELLKFPILEEIDDGP
jgi:hypothetical protein